MRRVTLRAVRAASLALATALAVPALPRLRAAGRSRAPAPDSFADLAARLLPAVVNISSSQTSVAQNSDRPSVGPEMPQFPPGSPFEQFFKDFLEAQPPRPATTRRRRRASCRASARASSSIPPASS